MTAETLTVNGDLVGWLAVILAVLLIIYVARRL